MVHKKERGFWICVDYRQLKHHSVKDHYQLPRIHEVFSDLHDAHFFFYLELLRGYHEIPIRVDDRPKTAFITHNGLFVFNLISYGLWIAQSTFQRVMDRIFRVYIGKDVATYLDELLMYAFQFHQILAVIDRILGEVIVALLKSKPRKCQIFQEGSNYVGHICRKGIIGADWFKLDKIREWPFPMTRNEVASFLGLCNYYARLIPHFSPDALPI